MYRIMFIDDEKNICEGLKVILDWEAEGFEIAGVAFNGMEALSQLIKTTVDVIVTDVRMPEIDGIELIKQLYEMDFQIKVIIISGYMEFDYARKAMLYGVKNYILKPINRDILVKTVRQIKEELDNETNNGLLHKKREEFIRGKVLLELVKHGVSREPSYYSDELGIIPEENSYYVCVVSYSDKYSSGNDDQGINSSNNRQIIKEMLIKSLGKSQCGYVFDLDEKDRFCILFCTFSQNIGYLKDVVLKNLYEDITAVYKKNIIIGLGNEAFSLENVHESYSNCCKVIKWKELIQEYGIACYNGSAFGSFSEALNWDHKNLIKFIRECDMDGVLRELDRLKKEVEALIEPNAKLYALTIAFFIDLASVISGMGYDFKSILDFQTNNEIYENNAIELLAFMKTVCVKAVLYINEKNSSYDNEVIDSIIHYLNLNYNSEISLAALSEKFYLSPGYIGKLFKKHLNMGYIDYISKIRMERAAALLEEGSLKIYEICEEVGYRDLNYFYRLFKKIIGASPAEYKKMSRKNITK